MAAVLLALSFTPLGTPDPVLFGDSSLVVQRVTLTSSGPYSGFSALKCSEKHPKCAQLSLETLPANTSPPAFFSDKLLCLANLPRVPVISLVKKPQQLPHSDSRLSEEGLPRARQRKDTFVSGAFAVAFTAEVSATSGPLRAF